MSLAAWHSLRMPARPSRKTVLLCRIAANPRMVLSLSMSNSRPGGTRFAMRGNTRIAYDPGSPPSPDAPVVVMLHALLADRSDFVTQRDALRDRFRVILPD